MAGVQLSGKQVKDGSIQRVDIDVVTTGSALITKVVGSARVTLSSTGVDAGTGDVTLDLGTTGVTANTYQSVTVDIYGRVTAAGSLTSGMLPSGSSYYIQNGSSSQSAGFNITGSGQMATLLLSNVGGKTLSITASSAQASNLSLAFPSVAGGANQVLMSDGANGLTWSSVGTVTSVGLSLPGIFSVTGSPVTTSGTLTATLATQAANTFLASVDGSSGTPTFRTIVAGDIGNAIVIGKVLTGYSVTSGTIAATDTILVAFQKLGYDKHVPVTLGTANGLSLSTQALSLQLATTSQNGALSSTDWNTFNGKQAGNATLTSLAALSTVTTGLVKLTNGTASLDSSVYITANQTITLSGGATGSGTTAITVTLSNTAVTGQALTGYAVGTNTALAATDTILGAFQKVQGQLNNKQASNATLTSLAALSTVTTGLVKLTNGTASLDTSAYLTTNQSITLSGDATGTGTTAITVSLTNASVTGQALTGYAVGTNTALASTDTILGAFGKLQAQVSAAGGGAGAVCTMDRGNIITNNNLAVNGTASCYLTSFISDQAMTITSTSEFECYIIQNGGNLRYAIYDNTYALIAYSAQLTAPAAGRALASTLTFASGTSYTLAAGTTYYMGVFISAGLQLGGMVGSATYNTTPYVATRTDNLTMTPPGTLTASETTVRLFIRLKA